MKHWISLFAIALGGCSINTNTSDCQDQQCVCPLDTACNHDCSAGAAECFVQGAPHEAVDVSCDHNASCHVECSASSSCQVDCGASGDCHVTCPPTGCTVDNCNSSACIVACADGSEASVTAGTATCP